MLELQNSVEDLAACTRKCPLHTSHLSLQDKLRQIITIITVVKELQRPVTAEMERKEGDK